MSSLVRRSIAELVGTAVLVFFAVGSAVFGIDKIYATGVALAFGLTLLILAYAIGPLSGCHVNPAVTLGVLLSKGLSTIEAIYYWIAQLLGGIIGAALIHLVLTVGNVKDKTGSGGTDNWGGSNGLTNAGGTLVVEVILTFLLVLVVLLVTASTEASGFAGLAIGLTLTVIHLVGIPLDGTSVNPARSFGPALFEGGTALNHVWVFLIAPLIGATFAAFLAPLLAAPAQRPEAG